MNKIKSLIIITEQPLCHSFFFMKVTSSVASWSQLFLDSNQCKNYYFKLYIYGIIPPLPLPPTITAVPYFITLSISLIRLSSTAADYADGL